MHLAAHPRDDLDEPAPQREPVGDEANAGCGWYESSWDLARGLLVTEHRVSPEAAALFR